MRAGALDCLRTPLMIELLKAKIRWYVEAKWMKKELQRLLQKEELKQLYKIEEVSNETKEEAIRLKKELEIATLQLRHLRSDLDAVTAQKNELEAANLELRKGVDSLVWRMQFLETESSKGEGLMLALQEKNREIEAMKQQVKQKWESPVQSLLSTISSFTDDPQKVYTAEDIKVLLANVVSAVSSNDIHAPKLDTMDFDDMTRKWMLDQYTNKTQTSSIPSERLGSARGKEALQKMVTKEKREQFLQNLNSLNVKIWEHSKEDAVVLVLLMFESMGMFEKFRIPVDKLGNFVRLVRENYHPGNPYHNFEHAFDVLQTVYVILRRQPVAQLLRSVDILGLMVAALCHDVNHPGLNNGYQVAAQTRLARVYNDISVLENHHCSKTFELADTPEADILSSLSPLEYKELRKVMIAAVIATDMTHHFELVSKFSARVDTKGSFSVDVPEDRQLVVNMLLHTSDISNVAKPFAISKVWADRVFEEFLNQGDVEKGNGMSVSPYMNREDSNQSNMTLGFIDYVCLPLFTAMHKLWDGTKDFLDNIHANRQRWASGETTDFVPKPSGRWQTIRTAFQSNGNDKLARVSSTPNILNLSVQLLQGMKGSSEAKERNLRRRTTIADPLYKTRFM